MSFGEPFKFEIIIKHIKANSLIQKKFLLLHFETSQLTLVKMKYKFNSEVSFHISCFCRFLFITCQISKGFLLFTISRSYAYSSWQNSFALCSDCEIENLLSDHPFSRLKDFFDFPSRMRILLLSKFHHAAN